MSGTILRRKFLMVFAKGRRELLNGLIHCMGLEFSFIRASRNTISLSLSLSLYCVSMHTSLGIEGDSSEIREVNVFWLFPPFATYLSMRRCRIESIVFSEIKEQREKKETLLLLRMSRNSVFT